MAGWCAGLCCSFQHSLVYGQSVLFVRVDSVYALPAWLSRPSSAFCWRLFVRVGLIKNVTGGIHSQDGQQWAGQRWSDMNNIVRMVGGEAVVAPEDFPFVAFRTSLSFIMAHSEGGLGIGIGALVRSCFMHVLLDGYGWLLHRSHLNLSGSGFHGRVLRARTARR
jgi:hypothetical protein